MSASLLVLPHSNPRRSRGNAEGWESGQQPIKNGLLNKNDRKERREESDTKYKDRNRRETVEKGQTAGKLKVRPLKAWAENRKKGVQGIQHNKTPPL